LEGIQRSFKISSCGGGGRARVHGFLTKRSLQFAQIVCLIFRLDGQTDFFPCTLLRIHERTKLQIHDTFWRGYSHTEQLQDRCSKLRCQHLRRGLRREGVRHGPREFFFQGSQTPHMLSTQRLLSTFRCGDNREIDGWTSHMAPPRPSCPWAHPITTLDQIKIKTSGPAPIPSRTARLVQSMPRHYWPPNHFFIYQKTELEYANLAGQQRWRRREANSAASMSPK
jgi:hypothetical protein